MLNPLQSAWMKGMWHVTGSATRAKPVIKYRTVCGFYSFITMLAVVLLSVLFVICLYIFSLPPFYVFKGDMFKHWRAWLCLGIVCSKYEENTFALLSASHSQSFNIDLYLFTVNLEFTIIPHSLKHFTFPLCSTLEISTFKLLVDIISFFHKRF